MVLKNYWKWAENTLKTNVFGDNMFATDIGMIAVDGQSCPIALRASSANDVSGHIAPNHMLSTNLSVFVGSGTGDVTVDDYNIENDITDNISNLTFSYDSMASDKIERTITITGTNNTGDTITINQVGIAKAIDYLPSSWTNKKVMFVKHQLTEALTVPNGDGFTITFKWIEA